MEQISLKKKIRRSYYLIIGIMIIPTVFSIAVNRINAWRYEKIITNITQANHINQTVNRIPGEMWNIVSGRLSFNNGSQYDYIQEMNEGLENLSRHTNFMEGQQKINVALRASESLYTSISRMGIQIAKNSSVKENQKLLEDIRGIVNLFTEIMQDYIVSQIQVADQTQKSMNTSLILFMIFQVLIIILALLFSLQNYLSFSRSIHEPISQMEELSTRIAGGDLSAKIQPCNVSELKNLADNMNIMTDRIQKLIQENIAEQQNLQKAQLKALQAQITPHFLYNTFDTIIWLAEGEQTKEVVQITRAFSEFLRTGLSRGHEWISVRQEMDHVKNYLTIQKVRYSAILNYSIEYDPLINDYSMLKLILQPLVENAIYHGIKNKRGRGQIEVKAAFTDQFHTSIKFSVTDNGAGFTPERLAQVKHELELSADMSESLTDVYGLYNVNKRLNLYYNCTEMDGSTGLVIESQQGKGTTVSFTVPCLVQMDREDV